MREIKFRAWDKNSGRMTHSDAYETLGLFFKYYDFMCSNRQVELMQYTGLKDKNGKEIYEGDIVRLKGNAFVSHEVYWDERFFQFRLCSVFIKDKQFDKTHLLDFAKMGEVIGNIYENPLEA